MTSVDAPSPPVRPKLNLAPRSAAASSGSAPTASGKPSPFGAARPREAVIAERTGVAETEVLKKDASQFASLRLRLTGEQSDQKRGKESELAEAKKALAEAKELGDDAITRIAASRCAEVEAELSTLMANFEVRARGKVTHARRRTHVALRLRRQLRNTHVLERARPSADSTQTADTHSGACSATGARGRQATERAAASGRGTAATTRRRRRGRLRAAWRRRRLRRTARRQQRRRLR
jgi:Plant specific eukaryotic initiation factor 4B